MSTYTHKNQNTLPVRVGNSKAKNQQQILAKSGWLAILTITFSFII